MKVLQFKVVEGSPRNPGEAAWNGTFWEIRDDAGMIWTISLSDDAVVDAAESKTDDDTLLKALAVALHPEAASKVVGK